MKLDGYEQLNRFLKMSQDQNINKEVLKLITNLSFGEQKRNKWLETEIIPNLLGKVRFMVFNATFNNISVISWRSVLLVEKTTDKLYHIMLYIEYTSPEFKLTMLVVIGTDCTNSCKFNYHTITPN